MATSTIIQKLYGADEAIAVPSVGQDNPFQSARQCTLRFRTSGAVAVGESVRFDVTQPDSERVSVVNQCTAGGPGGNRLAVGVALEASTALGGEFINVVVGGYVENAICVAGAGAGDVLGVVTAAGELEAMAGPDVRGAIAIALENEAGGTCDVWIITKFP